MSRSPPSRGFSPVVGDAATDRGADYPLWCDHTAHCAADQSRSFVGCCNDDATSCPIFTTCLDSTDWERYTTYNGYTLWWYVPVDPAPAPAGLT